MNKQPEALELADELAVFATWRDDFTGTLGKSETKLRRLHEANQAMLEALLTVARMAESLKRPCSMEADSPQAIRNSEYMNISYTARAAIAKGEQK